MIKAIHSLVRALPLFTLLITPALSFAESISEDLYSFQVLIGGDQISLPCTYEQLTQAGWTYNGDAEALLKPEDRTVSSTWEKNGVLLYGEMVNNSWDVLPVKSCVLAAVELSESAGKTVLPGGILPGVSQVREVIDAYGMPTANQKSGGLTQYSYQLDYDQEAVFSFYADTGILKEASLRNVVMAAAPDPTALKGGSASGSAMEYHAPGSLGNDPFSFHVSFGGALYALPAPVAEFVKNGWSIIDGADGVVKAYGSGQLTLSLNGSRWTTWVYNKSDKAALAGDCLITTIVSDEGRGDAPLILPGNVTTGMTEEDALSAYSAYTLKTSDSGSLRRHSFCNGRTGIILSVKPSTGLISRIEVTNTP